MPARFFTISDSRYFVGTVALLNSLRLTGNDEELVVLDRGLALDERRRLAEYATIVDLPEEVSASTYAVKPYPGQLDADGVVAIIDSDMIVTSSFASILEQAEAGRICAFPNHPSVLDRRFDEWAELFRLSAPMRQQMYLNAGFLAISVARWPTFFARWWDACALLPSCPPPRDDSQPLAQLDQDALNAILMSEMPADAIAQLPAYEWDLGKVTIEDARTLACRSAAGPVPLLHTPRAPKVWQPGGWRHVDRSSTAFVRLMPRVLFADDVLLTLSRREVPIWLRPGIPSRLLARSISAYNRLPWVFARARRIPVRAVREARSLARSISGRAD